MFYLTSFCLHFHNPNFFPLSPHCFQNCKSRIPSSKSYIPQVDSCWAKSCVNVNAFRYFSSSVRPLDVWYAVVVKWIPITLSVKSIPPSLSLLSWYIQWYCKNDIISIFQHTMFHQTVKVPYTDALLGYVTIALTCILYNFYFPFTLCVLKKPKKYGVSSAMYWPTTESSYIQ